MWQEYCEENKSEWTECQTSFRRYTSPKDNFAYGQLAETVSWRKTNQILFSLTQLSMGM